MSLVNVIASCVYMYMYMYIYIYIDMYVYRSNLAYPFTARKPGITSYPAVKF